MILFVLVTSVPDVRLVGRNSNQVVSCHSGGMLCDDPVICFQVLIFCLC
jgi:hypothetical protein